MTRALAVLVVALLFPASAVAEAPPEQTLSVIGHGIARVVPDVADVSISISSAQPTAVGARNSVNARTARIVGAIVGLGVPRAAVQTAGTELRRELYRPRKGAPRKVRYVASSQLVVHLVDLAKVSPVFDAATRLGATGFEGPSFGFSDPSAGRKAAERAALVDARARADAAAEQLGLRVIGVRAVDLDPGSDATFGSGKASGSAQAVSGTTSRPTPVLPGTEEVDADVAVVYVLGS